MFFADPTISFANLRAGMKPRGRLAFACWRAARENPFFVVPLRAAADHVPPLPETGPEDPGPFAFADERRVRRVLTDAGFADIDLASGDFELDVGADGGLEAAVATAMSLGPASRALQDQPESTLQAAMASIRTALAAHADGDRIPLGAAVWFVTARNPA
jgi:hypothetical protein